MSVGFRHTETFKFKPKVKQRPRLGRRGRVFTPAQTLEFEKLVATTWSNVYVCEFPVDVTIKLYKNKFTVTVAEHEEHPKSKIRGDIDNFAKSILDGLNGVAFIDDSLVKKLVISKHE